MPNLTSETAACELIEKLELWRDFALGKKDVNRGPRTAVAAECSLLLRCYAIYRGYFDGTIRESTWRRWLATLPLLLSTNHGRAALDSAQAPLPADFRAWLRSLHS